MENEEQFAPEENIEIPTQKPKRKWVKWAVGLILFAWFFSTTDASNGMKVSATNSDFKTIAENSNSNFFKVFKEGNVYSNAIVYLDESITDAEAIRLQKNIDLAMQFLHDPLRTKTFDIRIFDDYESLKADMLYMTPQSMVSSVNYELSEEGVFGADPDCEIGGSVGIAYGEGWFRPRIFILTECGWAKDSEGIYQLTDPDVIAHEITHVAQDSWFGSDYYTWSCFVPKWFTEGQAQFVSAQIATLDNNFDYKLFRSNWIYWAPDSKLEPDEDYESMYGPYSDGAFAIEYLVGKYGWESFDTLVAKLQVIPVYECDNSDVHKRFADAFKITYGISLATFYEQIEDYIDWNLSELEDTDN